jgi:hypothetical protein
MSDIKVEETAPGHINITCERSGLPFTRTTPQGMFCDAEQCECEQESQAFEASPEHAQLEKLIDWFSQ